VLTLEAKLAGAAYGQEDLELLDMLAPSAALALENARLYQSRMEMLGQQVTRVVAAQEEERGRIARELHDGVGPSLASLGLRLHTVRKGLERRGDPAAAAVGELEEQAQANIRDIRRVIDDLRPAALDGLGLVPALQEYAERYRRERAIEVELVVADGWPELPAPVETALYRITQEALANVHRHAGANRAEVRLARVDGDVLLEVADDGQGFDPSAPLPGIHVGLWSMRQRAEQFGGRFSVRSAPGQGTCVAVTLPLDETA
jgi:signal transduction histidine kinase